MPDRRAARLAARQKTIVTAAQLQACGLGRRAIKYRVETGRLHPEFRGVYSFGCGELPPLAREQAALLACGERTFLSHQTAAFVWGLQKVAPPLVHVTVVGRYCAARTGIAVHRIKAIDRRELRRHQGLWVSWPARAVLELAGATDSRTVLADAIDEGLARRLFTPDQLNAILARNRPCRGAARLAELLGDDTVTAISRSRAEKAMLRLIRDAGLPRPETNVRIGRYEADFLWREQRLVVELDGFSFHRGPASFHRDHEKDLAFRDAGLDVLRFTPDHAVNQPARVLARLAGTLALRTPRA